MSEVVRFQNTIAVIDLVTYDPVDLIHIIIRNRLRRACRCELTADISTLICLPVVPQVEHERLRIGEHVTSRQKPAIPLGSEEVRQRRKDIDGAYRIIYNDRIHLLQAAAPKDQAVVVTLQVVGYGIAIQFGQQRHLTQRRVVIQSVWEMIRRDTDHGLIRDTCLLQLIDEVGQCRLKLQVTCDIRLYILRIRQVLHLIPMLPGHGVGVVAVRGVSADGHVVNVERLLVDVLRECTFHHFQVTLRPAAADVSLRAVSDTFETIAVAQVHMCQITAVIRVIVVVEHLSIVAQPVKLTSHGEIVVVACGLLHGFTAHGGEEAHQVLKLTAGGSCRSRLIVIREVDALG